MANDNLDPNNPNNEAPPGQHANGGGNESGGGDKPLPEETPEPDKGNPRPFPNPARRKVDRDNTRIFAFLVGVNSYQGPITKLNGCVRDVNNIAGYLRARFGDDDQKDAAPIGATESVDRTEVHQRLFMRSLTNAEATYDNVIAAFQEHLLGVREAGVDSDVPVPTGDDTFWFHFSGHGSEQFTAEELLPQDPNGKDQTLVCYNPGGHTTGIFLADKELAILIDRINSRIRTLTKRPHVLVTLDACHSGSGTRDFLEEPGVQTRNFEFLTAKTRNDDGIPPGHIRTIDTYFGDLNPANPVIPESSHLLIAACSNVEKAGDLGKLKGGVFTSSLVEVLGEYGADEDVPYYDLFERTRSRARSKRSSQHAQFESIGNFNTYTSWLEGYRVEDKGKRYKILPDGDGWSIQCGVLHGLPTELDRSNLSAEQQADAPVKTMIEVFLGDESLGFAEVTDIGLQDSTINLILDDGVELEKRIIDADDGVFESAHPYYGVIFSLPAPAAYVWVHGHEATVELLKQQWDEELEEGDVQLRNLNIIPVDQEGDSRGEPVLEVEATLEPVRLEDGSMTEKAVLAFRSTETGLSWTTLNEAQSLEFIPVAKENIEKIIRWHRFYDMDNDKTKLREEFEMQFLESDKIALDPNSDIRSQLRGHNTTELKLYRGPSTFFRQTINNKAVDVVPYALDIKHKEVGPELFFYLYELESNGAISLLNPSRTHIEGAEEGQTHSTSLDAVWQFIDLRSILVKPEEQEEHLWYKLLVTRKRLEKPEQLNQSAFKNARETRLGFSLGSTTDLNDWCSHTLKVTIIRQHANINQAGEVGFPDASISIMEHDSVEASVALIGASGNTRSVDPANQLTRFETAGVSLLDLSDKHADRRKSVLELTNLNNVDDTQLAQNPLQIKIRQVLKEDETVQPVAFDGEFIRVIGDASPSGAFGIDVNIRSLPEVHPPFDPDGESITVFGEQKADRSLFKALKLAFFKWSNKDEEDEDKQAQREDSFFRLARVIYQEDGSIKRKSNALKSHVFNAENILVLLHGIIGDTKSIAENLPHIINEDGHSMTDEYDLVLTFDYENLDTPIGEIAEKLERELGEAGIKAGNDKQITIMAHSMGGLVSRALIEHENRTGAAFVKHLIMVGTPNQGSPFGDVPNWLHFAKTGLEIAANFLPSNIRSFGDFFRKVRDGVPANGLDVFTTLEQMNPTSEFLRVLNDPENGDPGVRYSIIAGDSSQYDTDGSKFQRFVERTQIRLGDLMNEGEDHDIAVSLESIFNNSVWSARGQAIPDSDKQLVACHHLNYFITPVCREAIAKIALP